MTLDDWIDGIDELFS